MGFWGSIWDAGKGALFGDGEDPGLTGAAVRDIKPYQINEKGFTDTTKSDMRQDQLSTRLTGVDNRAAPQSAYQTLGQASQTANAAPAVTYSGARIDTSQADETRANQTKLLASLQSANAGQGPSVAQAQLQQSTDAAIANQRALAAAANPTNAGLAMRQAAMAGAQLQGTANAQAAQLRAQEQQQARAELGNVLSGMRSTDLTQGTSQAQLAQQAGLAGATARNYVNALNANIALANTTARNQFQQAQFSANQANSQFNATAQLQNQAQKDAQTQFLLGNQLSLDERDRQALQALEKMKVDQDAEVQKLKADAYKQAQSNRQDLISNVAGIAGKIF